MDGFWPSRRWSVTRHVTRATPDRCSRDQRSVQRRDSAARLYFVGATCFVGGMDMNLDDLHFPSDATVAAEEAARFRAASPEERMRAIRSALAGGAVLIAKSPRRAFLEAYHRRQEELAREMISRFVVRHAGNS